MNANILEFTIKTRNDFLKEVVKPMVKRRKELKMTQEEVNHELGVAERLVSKWECGMRTPSSFNLHCWAEVLGGRIQFVVDEDLLETPESMIRESVNDNLEINKISINSQIVK